VENFLQLHVHDDADPELCQFVEQPFDDLLRRLEEGGLRRGAMGWTRFAGLVGMLGWRGGVASPSVTTLLSERGGHVGWHRRRADFLSSRRI
jgi:hypothetical protein